MIAERLRELLNYDSETGVFTWRVTRSGTALAGQVAGAQSVIRGEQMYVIIGVDRRRYHAHRLAWLWMTGTWPPSLIDHRNLNGRDNRWCNLRLASEGQNRRNHRMLRNNTSGFTGVYFSKAAQKWQAYIRADGRSQYIGIFTTAIEAAHARDEIARRLHGDFATLNFPSEVAA